MPEPADFLVPDLGEGLDDLTLVEWRVAVGDTVELNQVLCTVETAKADPQEQADFLTGKLRPRLRQAERGERAIVDGRSDRPERARGRERPEHRRRRVEGHAGAEVWGTPERCIESLRNIQRTTGAAEFVGVFNYGDLPVDLAEQSMRLFADKVLPVMQKEEAAPVFR